MAETFNLQLLLAVVVVIATFILRPFFGANKVSHEPPSVPATIPVPFIGHVIGLFWQRTAYYTNLSLKWNFPIFSISMFGGKVHVVSSGELMHSLHKLPKSVSFWFMEAKFTTQLGGMSERSSASLTANLHPESRDSSLLIEGLKATQHAMSPQGGVEDMNRAAAKVTKERLDELLSKPESRRNVDLWAWVQHEITVVTTESVYGPANPYRDEKVEVGFWNFADDTIMLLMTSVLPNIIAAKALAGRQTVVEAMDRYFAAGSYKDGSSLVNARYSALKGHIDDEDLARFECVNGIAILANTVPTAFWTIYHVFSDPIVLEEVRRQVTAITTSEMSLEGDVRTIDIRRLKEAPILFSTIQEALRLRATGTGPRMVMEDISVGQEGYQLKKDSVVIIANKALHYDKAMWGETADTYVADRFCGRTPAHAFRGFGGGINLCPGRGFAMVEVAAMVAMLTARFDMVPATSGGWCEPGQDMSNMSLQIAPPRKKVMVDLVRRSDLDDASWRFVV
ncbi:cytochrome P450 [Lindgomyces ingoldianus]|uniref:Cytochrome P450 n=1 Tax=Lindgomyces ingoldianus TaxID=673940 RepID=A0ACB6R7Q1_9PLEO|nr:cytochrome P450 [Lindgomyces ingoldianus]KAF2475216.1 cytochrome P450 [Lindgomyces ingoldianus]